MADDKYFIMINNRSNNKITPLVDSADGNIYDVKLFDSVELAEESANTNLLCQAYGYEIFRRGSGEV